MKTITKFCTFVIFLFAWIFTLTNCAFESSRDNIASGGQRYGAPVVVGRMGSSDITESSGIAASRCQRDVLWTHNDSGDDAFIFAMNPKGVPLGTWKVTGAQNIDWEDIAAYKDKTGKCYVYIAEIGDNKVRRHEHLIYRVAEPVIMPGDAASNRKEPLTIAGAEIVRFSYPDFDQDAETLAVHPQSGSIYVVTKRVSGPAGVYRVKPEFGQVAIQKAELIAELSVPAIPNGLLTGGDISPDGRHLIICDYARAYEFDLPKDASDFDEIWKQEPTLVELGTRKVGEAICYSVDGTSIFATSEGRNAPIIELIRRK